MNWRLLFSDIRFWIIILFAARIISIDMPVFDSHSWRQADGYAVARNFLEEDNNILYRRIDNREATEGITPSEFPLHNYLTYLFYLISGVQWWPGRLINLIITSFGLYSFFRICGEIKNKEVAFYSTIILGVSIWFAFGKKLMPDTFSASLVLISLDLFYRFIKSEKKHLLVLASLFLTFGLLSKISSFVILPLGISLFYLSQSQKIKWQILITGFISSLPVVAWYFYWNPYIASEFGYDQVFIKTELKESLSILASRSGDFFRQFYQHSMYYVGFVFSAVGFLLVFKEKTRLIFTAILSVSALMVYILLSGLNFVEHTYYIIPFLPFMALCAGFSFQKLPKDYLKIIFIAAISAECLINQSHEFKTKETDKPLLQLERFMDEHTNRKDLIGTNSSLNTNILYFCHRKGWTKFSKDYYIKYNLKLAVKKGCKFILWNTSLGEKTKIPYEYQLVASYENYDLLKLYDNNN